MFSSRMNTMVIIALGALLCIADISYAQPGGRGGMRRMFDGGGLAGLLRNDKVREELELVDDQLEELEEINMSLREEMMNMFRNGGFRDMDESERREKMEEMRERMQERMKEMEGEIEDLLLPDQFKRLKQLRFQRESSRNGTEGLAESDVIAEELGLTDEQKEKMKEAAEKAAKKLAEKMKELRRQAEEEVLSVLTSEQRKKFDELRGDAFDFEDERRGRRGGRDRGDRERRGGPPRRERPDRGDQDGDKNPKSTDDEDF